MNSRQKRKTRLRIMGREAQLPAKCEDFISSIDALSWEDSMDQLIHLLQNGKRFTFLRFGDGCFLMMLPQNIGKVVGRSNMFKVDRRLQEGLIQSFNLSGDNNYTGTVVGTGSVVEVNLPSKVMKVLCGFLNKPKRKCLSAVCIQSCFLEEDFSRFTRFLNLIKEEGSILVGSYNNEYLESFLNLQGFVETKRTNCHVDIDEIYSNLLEVANSSTAKNIILAAGQTSKLIVERLEREGVLQDKNFIDFGSVVDMFSIEDESFERVKVKRSHITNNRGFIRKIRDELQGRL